MTPLRGSAAIVAFVPAEWDPSTADQLAQYNALLQSSPGLDVELIQREGEPAVQLLDAEGVVRWSHDGPMSAA